MKKCIIFILCALALLASCSTQKNTALSRSFHSTKVKYNIYYNGDLAYQEGLEAIAKAHEDDYSRILPLYPVSDHQAAQSATAKMDRTIEKCRKCIKLHSIKKRPKANPKKMKDPSYREWLKREEFNPSMPMAWIRLGQAEFHKGDFLGSVSTFAYIQRHFDYDKDLMAQCQLWSVRAYAEMGWLYEAEDLLRKVKIDDLSRKHASLYSAVSADLLLKQKRYREAIPQVKIAKEDENRKTSRPRFEYVLGQLYELQGEKADALAAYHRVLKLTPEWAMDFNARLRITQLQSNSAAALKDLDKMIKRDKYKDYLDQLYGAKGNIYLSKGDTVAALEQYALAAEKSTKSGDAKAAILLKAGDLYFERQDYAKAQPCYAEALTIIKAESEEYARVSKRSEVLDDLVLQTTTVQLQDSLQHLASLSPEEQQKVVEKIIADLIEQERQDSIAAAQAARDAENGTNEVQSVNTSKMIGGGGGSAEWYFYNANLLKQGKQQFRQKWGSRTLEDNWRRKIKMSVSLPDETGGDEDDLTAENDSLSADSLANDSTAQQPLSTDAHDPQYYLQQIPKTQEDLQQSDSTIAEALYNLVLIYQDRLEDEGLAQETFEDLKRRYPNDSHLLDLYYMQYLQSLKKQDTIAAAQYRQEIISRYPDSKYAQVVSDPNYFERLKQAQAAGDSLYEATYLAYRAGNYAEVKRLTAEVETDYPLTTLMPRFLFLKSVAVAKTDGQDAFVASLQDLVSRYSDSQMGAMAKDMLSMMNQGMESQKGGSTSSLADKRQAELEEDLAKQDSIPESERVPMVVITIPQNEQKLNRLLYEVALYNFSQFMIKDFELETVPSYSATESALQITGFDSQDDVAWYKGLLLQNQDIQNVFTQLGATVQ